jgi:5'-nucleotidase (lipoprotein e(P4) family)
MTRTLVAAVIGCLLLTLSAAEPTGRTHESLNAVLWMQTAVEYKASAVETYRAAKAALLRGLKNKSWTAAMEQTQDAKHLRPLPPAVILDLDETVLDNSPFEAHMLTTTDPKQQSYSSDLWTAWVKDEKAGVVPGALEFLQFAEAHGVAPLYITNRECNVKDASDPTVQVLRKLQLPLDANASRLFCAEGQSDKTARRAKCAENFRILLLIGDQLSDFLQIPADAASLEGREKLYEAHQSMWGERWFQLPNAMYGSGKDSWEGVVGFAAAQKLQHLRPWRPLAGNSGGDR